MMPIDNNSNQQSPTMSPPRSPGKMRATRSRPSSQHGVLAAQQQGRKVFNCIVDDSALVAGVKRSTRNGIRQWVKNGQIRLFVPLHALDQLSRLKNAGNRYSDDVRETLHWLDDATSKFPNVVTLQGADEIYETWPEVERFSVPRTLFSEDDGIDVNEIEAASNSPIEPDMGALTLDDSIRKSPASSAASNASRSLSPSSMHSQLSSLSAMSPPTSPIKAVSSPAKTGPIEPEDTTLPSGASVPLRLQPLFNYIIWRVHQELDPVAALESFIFLCNDQSKVNYAKGFDIKTKRLEQLRDAIGREDRDFKNRQIIASRDTPAQSAASVASTQRMSIDGTDDVLLRPPPKAPAAMLSKQNIKPNINVMDPDAFGRNTQVIPMQNPPLSPRAPPVAPQALRGGLPYAPRRAYHARGYFRGGPRGRGGLAGPGRGGFAANNRHEGVMANGQIDPNSFVRPREPGYAGRGGRRLWTPT